MKNNENEVLTTRFRAEGGITNNGTNNFAAPAAPTDAKPTDWRVTSALPLSGTGYPGMGSMYAQIWRGDNLVAVVYGNNESEVQARASFAAAQSVRDAAQPTTDLIEAGALRQFCHNDGSAGFVFAYDKAITDRVFAALKAQPTTAPEEVRDAANNTEKK